VTYDVYSLPPDLPAPVDDGAADHLLGTMLPQLTLESSQGPMSMRELSRERLVLYVYPRAGGRSTSLARSTASTRRSTSRRRARRSTRGMTSCGR